MCLEKSYALVLSVFHGGIDYSQDHDIKSMIDEIPSDIKQCHIYL